MRKRLLISSPLCALPFIMLLLTAPYLGKTQPPPLQVCSPGVVRELLDALPAYRPTDQEQPFITLQNDRFYEADIPYIVHGINYYPAHYPWRRFLSADMNEVSREFELIQNAGFNTLRIFLWYEALFQCEGTSQAVPEAQGFIRFEEILRAAAEHEFRLIVTLHDLPDLTNYPLYEQQPFTIAQTEFILSRYRDEPAILAWDLRNEGDIDYSADRGSFSREQVLAWLADTSELAQEAAPNHLLTAGWLNDSYSTAPYVDFISFHHWADATALRQRIVEIRAHTNLPILLEEIGYNTLLETPERQHDLLLAARQTIEAEDLLGWLIWTAFDFPTDVTCFPPPCTSPNNHEHYFGI